MRGLEIPKIEMGHSEPAQAVGDDRVIGLQGSLGECQCLRRGVTCLNQPSVRPVVIGDKRECPHEFRVAIVMSTTKIEGAVDELSGFPVVTSPQESKSEHLERSRKLSPF